MYGPARRNEPFGQRGDYPLPPLKCGPKGRWLCRWCEGDVPRGARYWCGKACVLEYRMRADWGFIRDQIIGRDKVCQDCGGARYSCVGGRMRAPIGWKPNQTYFLRRWQDMKALIWGPFNALEIRWEVDHIVPVVEGGTDDPRNLRLLCLPCHQDRTRLWRRARANGPQSELPLD
jgi:5-methylcytosine-specific restriction protein A